MAKKITKQIPMEVSDIKKLEMICIKEELTFTELVRRILYDYINSYDFTK